MKEVGEEIQLAANQSFCSKNFYLKNLLVAACLMVMDIIEDHFGKSLKIATKIPQVQKENFSSCCNSQH